MIVPLVEPYALYNGQKLYHDGLAFLGYVHTPKLPLPYQLSTPNIGNENPGEELRRKLALATGLTDC